MNETKSNYRMMIEIPSDVYDSVLAFAAKRGLDPATAVIDLLDFMLSFLHYK